MCVLKVLEIRMCSELECAGIKGGVNTPPNQIVIRKIAGAISLSTIQVPSRKNLMFSYACIRGNAMKPNKTKQTIDGKGDKVQFYGRP